MKRLMSILFSLIISSCIGIQAAEQFSTLDLPIRYKLYLDNAVKDQNIDTIIDLLTSENSELEDFRNNYPLAMKLYRILTEYSPGEDFTIEARYIPIQSIINVTQALAQEGGNDLFLKNMPR
jgi:hypothetical protein